jgi:hypothetical protein
VDVAAVLVQLDEAGTAGCEPDGPRPRGRDHLVARVRVGEAELLAAPVEELDARDALDRAGRAAIPDLEEQRVLSGLLRDE